MKELLKKIIFEQQEACKHFVENTIPRHIEEEWLNTSEVLIISGIRRCGKSVLVQQLRQKLPEKDFFFNFDDERLIKFSVSDFQTLQECFYELFGEQHTYYFDEIQNVEGWETFVRRLYNEGNKVIVTGSNARMLSRELGTHLTGRYISVEIYPFSFSEYLELCDVHPEQKDFFTTSGRSLLVGRFRDYLERGGFPKYLQTSSPVYLSALYESIVFRDVIVRNGLTNEKEIKELVFYLASNAAKRITYTSLGKAIGVRHAETVKNYLEYIQQTYLIFQLLKYDTSLKTQMLNPKKVYFIDNAIVNRIGFNVTENAGIKLENLVLIELKRRGCDVFYYSDKKECDFVVRQGFKVVQAFQVTASMSDAKTGKREIDGLLEAMRAFNLKEGHVLTLDEKEEIVTEEGIIHVLPTWEWMLKETC
ncbi:MAG: ATP-binding protein [Alloprevotella sp.]